MLTNYKPIPRNLFTVGEDPNVWSSLVVFNLYRIALATIFVASIFITKHTSVLGIADPVVFAIVSIIYLSASVLAGFAIYWKWPNFENIVIILTMIDICALTIIMHTSGGLESGLGMLIVVAIAGNSLLTNGKAASLFASLAVLGILTEQIVSFISRSSEPNFTQAGFLGAAVFTTALLSHVLSKRLRETQELAEQRGIDLENMAQLNEHVIKRLQSGVIVVDNENKILLMNNSARQMFDIPISKKLDSNKLDILSIEIYQQLVDWKKGELNESKPFRISGTNIDVFPSFTQLGVTDNSATLIFIEDAVRMAQQAQQMKLASLGRLTASIAHEIRNPLGAISHADQLLSESPNLNPSDKRLTEIIHTHTERVNGIIENILQLSRRDNTSPVKIPLNEWMEKFISELTLSENIDPATINLNIEPKDISVVFDPTQLHQIMWNLSHNGIRYSSNYPENPKVEFQSGLIESDHRPFLDVIDHGPGIDSKYAHQIFEPFFTTDSRGTGLGLYIVRELCQLNKARVQYIAPPGGGSCFRIEFSGQLAN